MSSLWYREINQKYYLLIIQSLFHSSLLHWHSKYLLVMYAFRCYLLNVTRLSLIDFICHNFNLIKISAKNINWKEMSDVIIIKDRKGSKLGQVTLSLADSSSNVIYLKNEIYKISKHYVHRVCLLKHLLNI